MIEEFEDALATVVGRGQDKVLTVEVAKHKTENTERAFVTVKNYISMIHEKQKHKRKLHSKVPYRFPFLEIFLLNLQGSMTTCCINRFPGELLLVSLVSLQLIIAKSFEFPLCQT